MHVALIDDDAAVLDSLRLYLGRNGIVTTCFATADAFLGAEAGVGPFDCVVADVRMPGTSGLDMVTQKGAGDVPVILITGHGEIDMAVAAIKAGAFDFIEKPFDESRLLESIRTATARASRKASEEGAIADLRTRYRNLTGRQREVMQLAASGLSNKEIGNRLGISARTVEIHRAWMMEKLGASNLAELVRMDLRLDGGLDS